MGLWRFINIYLVDCMILQVGFAHKIFQKAIFALRMRYLIIEVSFWIINLIFSYNPAFIHNKNL